MEKRNGASVNASSGKVGLNYAFDAFGNHFDLKLEKNDVILPPLGEGEGGGGGGGGDCHFIHRSETMTAAFASCEGSGVNGMVFTRESAYDVRQLGPRLRGLVNDDSSRDGAGEGEELFLVKRCDV